MVGRAMITATRERRAVEINRELGGIGDRTVGQAAEFTYLAGVASAAVPALRSVAMAIARTVAFSNLSAVALVEVGGGRQVDVRWPARLWRGGCTGKSGGEPAGGGKEHQYLNG